MEQLMHAPETSQGHQVEVRRNLVLNTLVGLVASAVAVAYLYRATDSGGWAAWVVCGVMTLVAITQFSSLMDARVPLWIADDEGVRIRLGAEWVGLPWLTISQVITEQRDLPWREGRVIVVPRNIGHVIDGLSDSAQREVRWQRRLHGAPLSVPLSLFTRVSSHQFAHDVRLLAAGRAEVVGYSGRERAQLEGERPRKRREDVQPEVTEPEIAALEAVEPEPTPEPEPRPAPRIDPVAAVRAARKVMRLDVVRDERPRIVPEAGPLPVAEAAVPSAVPSAEPVAVLDDLEDAGESAPQPVIGPEIAAARVRAGLTIDQLSERTRIRPHVLEAIEIDDFGPSGGDFYARGHLSTLSRYLGLEVDELHRQYDEHYAAGPINARRVFEAELASGLSGGLRATSGGPRWSLLVGAALSLTMIWGVARYFTDEPAPVATTVAESAELSGNNKPITSELTETSKLAVKAVEKPVNVIITDRSDVQLFAGRIAAGDRVVIAGVGPFKVTSSKAGHARLWLDDKEIGLVGEGVARASRHVG